MGRPGLDAVRWIELPTTADERGRLTAIEAARDIPFPVLRVFYMHHMVAERGGHAHRDTHQVVVAAAGSFRMGLSDASRTGLYLLDDPARGLYMPPMVFLHIHDITPGAVCLVLADTHYDRDRSYRSWEAYREALRGEGEGAAT
ncbi:MAG: FdtA/QdtA family cupin domain-containing protein [Planctomycetes bacterium]|nr:FdtA/QdtA family cupin domain-containing protein [Planctomycetota bacterium]